MRILVGERRAAGLELDVRALAPSELLELPATASERCVVILGGGCAVDVPSAGLVQEGLGQRADVFDGLASALYLPPRTAGRLLGGSQGASLAIVSAAVEEPPSGTVAGSAEPAAEIIGPDRLHTEERGRGVWRRTVHDILGPAHGARRLVVGETFSRVGVWSGYPPHKHDRHDPPREHAFDEVFLVRVRPDTGFGILLHYPEGAEREAATVVRDGDEIVLTDGYHSFVAAAEHELYYLWALAGNRKELAMTTDPRHDWISRLPVEDEPEDSEP